LISTSIINEISTIRYYRVNIGNKGQKHNNIVKHSLSSTISKLSCCLDIRVRLISLIGVVQKWLGWWSWQYDILEQELDGEHGYEQTNKLISHRCEHCTFFYLEFFVYFQRHQIKTVAEITISEVVDVISGN